MAPYPNINEITYMFKHMETGDHASTFAHVSPDVDWTVMGTHPLAGRYTTLNEFQEATFKRLGRIMKPTGIRLKVRNVIGAGEQPWAVVELIAVAECLNGYNFENTYSWVMRFNEGWTIVEVRAYLDSNMVKEALEQNKSSKPEVHRAPVPALG